MLQIISGKFFDTEDRFHTECKAVLYSNVCFSGKHQFAHITMEPTELRSEVETYIISYDNQLQKISGGFQLIKIGDEEIAFQFTNIIAFLFDCVVDKDESTVKRLCTVRPTTGGRVHAPSDFILTTVSSKKDASDIDIKQADEITEKIIGLCREDYINIINCIVAYNASIRLLSTDVSLAYSMLVYCLESLAQKYDNYNATWDDYNQNIKNTLEKAFQNIEPIKADEIKKILVSDGHFKLSQRFKSFVTGNVRNSFFVNIPDRVTIGKDDFEVALNNAYIMRSRYAHMLNPIMNQLTNSGSSKTHDTIEFQHNIYFTYSGLLRTVREVIMSFVLSRPQHECEKVNWYNELPNMIELEAAPYFWLWKKDCSNGKLAVVKLEGFIECFLYHRDKIPNMDDLALHYLNHLSEMKSDNRSAAFALSYIYYSRISNIEETVRKRMQQLIEKSLGLIKECNIYNIIAAQFMVEGFEHLTWETTDLLQVVKKYRKDKNKRNNIKLPNIFEISLYLMLSNSYKDDSDIEQQKIWLDIAYNNANNFSDIQKHIKECIASNDIFDLSIIGEVINSKYSTQKEKV